MADDGEPIDDLEAEWREAGFTLHRPIKRKDGEIITRVEFLEPTTGMLKAMDGPTGDVAKGIALVSRMTNLTLADVHEMHPRDFARCQVVAQGFFGEFLSAGGES